jgi:excisionase family DNA binding protein
MYSVNRGLGMKKGLITVKEAANILGVSIQTVIRWDKRGKLKAIRHPMNNYRLYKRVEIRELAEQIGKNPQNQQKAT